MEGFGELSPSVGELDEAAISEALAEDPDRTLDLLAAMTAATDLELRRLARILAARLYLDLARASVADASGTRRLVSAPYQPDAGDLDLDRSMNAILSARAERRLIEPEDLRVLRWAETSTAWCLLVDASGSMHGKPSATAGLAAAAVAARAPREYAVLSFSSHIVAAKAMWEHYQPDAVIDRVLALRGHGTTDVAGALAAGRHQLSRSGARRRVVVLLSDCRATEPGDVVAAARSLEELFIICPDGDSEAARELAEEVGARWTTVEGPSDVVAAFSRVLGAQTSPHR